MRLLSSALFLLAVSYSLALPCNRDCEPEAEVIGTTIETIVETRTVVHTVTASPAPCDAEPELDTISTEDRLKQLEKEFKEAQDDLWSRTTPRPPCKQVTMPVPEVVPEHTTPAADVSETTRQCTCDETSACRTESQESLNDCMTECGDELEIGCEFTAKHLDCFKVNNASIIEAENYLFKNSSNFCTTTTVCGDKTIESVDYEQYTNIAYSPDPNSAVKDNVLWKNNVDKYNRIQNFSYCTRNCLHKKFFACTATAGCAAQLPTVDEFTNLMRASTKQNYKISNSIVYSCQCLAWKNQVKSFQGSCVTIGNKYFVDNA